MKKCVSVVSKVGITGVCGLILAFTVTPAKADTLTFTGNTDGTNQTWTRPTVLSDPPTITALVGGGEGWVAQEFSVSTSGSYTYSSIATGAGTADWGSSTQQTIVGFLYENSFDSTKPLSNVLMSNGGAASWTANLTAGINYFVVVTGYCGTGSGPGTSPHHTAACAGPSTLKKARLVLRSLAPEPLPRELSPERMFLSRRASFSSALVLADCLLPFAGVRAEPSPKQGISFPRPIGVASDGPFRGPSEPPGS